MSLPFQNAPIYINNSGILAEGGSLSSSNGLEPFNLLGFQNSFHKTVTAPFQTDFFVNYISEFSNDPIYKIVSFLQTGFNNFHFDPENVVAANISGQFYLRNYNISISPNTLIKSSASFIGYNQLSGSYDPSPRYTNQNAVGNGFQLLYFKDGNIISSIVYGFQYSFEAQWTPEYILGQVQPLQVQLSNKKETIQIIRDNFNKNQYSGSVFNDFDSIYLYNTGNGVLEFSLTGFHIKSQETNLNTNNIVLQTLTLFR